MKRSVVALSVMMVLVMALAAPAAAAPPPWAGPPEVETIDLADDEEAPTFVCNGRVLEFSGGEVTFRGRMLPNDGFVGTGTFRDAEATDQFGTTYQVRGSVLFRGQGEEGAETGRFQILLTFIGPDGQVDRAHVVFTVVQGEESVAQRGNCEFIE